MKTNQPNPQIVEITNEEGRKEFFNLATLQKIIDEHAGCIPEYTKNILSVIQLISSSKIEGANQTEIANANLLLWNYYHIINNLKKIEK